MQKILHISMAALGAALLTGCGATPEQGLTDGIADRMQAVSTERAEDHTPLEVTTEQAAAASRLLPTAGPALDARVAAAVAPTAPGSAPTAPGAGVTGAGWLGTWYTGYLAPGAQQHWYWHNSGNFVYRVGFAPAGPTSAGACQIRVVRSWDVQAPSGGERQFHFILQNNGSVSCGANVLLQSQAPAATWSTGVVSPGVTRGWVWNNANPLTAAHFVNVAPAGSTSTSTCEFEVTRSWYAQQPTGERKFYFYVKNVGSIACSGTVLLGANADVNGSWSTGTISPGRAYAWYWNNANPRNRVYVPGVSPLGATGSSTCQLELLPTYYQLVLNADLTTQRRYYIGVKNVGSIACSGTMLLNYIDPIIGNPLPVSLSPQQTDSWCWAASGEMVMSYLGGFVSQCDQANRRFGRSDCCNDPTPSACVQGGWPEFDKYGFSYSTGGALSWTDLKSQIDSRRTPVAFSWGWTGGGGHMMVAIGYKVIAGQNYVTINDPWAPNTGNQRDITYAEYVSGADHTHWTDYYNFSR